MSTNDEEATVEPMPRVRRRKVITHGSQCRDCGRIARSRVDDGKLGKYRRFKCMNDACPFFISSNMRNRRYWTHRIPPQAIFQESGQWTGESIQSE
jgi:hypothetical protein